MWTPPSFIDYIDYTFVDIKQLQKKLRQNDLTWALYLVAHNAWNFSGAAISLRI
jgi:hypothetical protein